MDSPGSQTVTPTTKARFFDDLPREIRDLIYTEIACDLILIGCRSAWHCTSGRLWHPVEHRRPFNISAQFRREFAPINYSEHGMYMVVDSVAQLDGIPSHCIESSRSICLCYRKIEIELTLGCRGGDYKHLYETSFWEPKFPRIYFQRLHWHTATCRQSDYDQWLQEEVSGDVERIEQENSAQRLMYGQIRNIL